MMKIAANVVSDKIILIVAILLKYFSAVSSSLETSLIVKERKPKSKNMLNKIVKEIIKLYFPKPASPKYLGMIIAKTSKDS
jgi:hypothetical protein